MRRWAELQPATLAEMAERCLLNAEDAARMEANAQREVDRCVPGDASLPEALYELAKYRIEQRAWRNSAAFWRGRAAKEGAHVLVPLPPGMERILRDVRPAPVAAADSRLPREPGDDDEVTTVEGDDADALPF